MRWLFNALIAIGTLFVCSTADAEVWHLTFYDQVTPTAIVDYEFYDDDIEYYGSCGLNCYLYYVALPNCGGYPQDINDDVAIEASYHSWILMGEFSGYASVNGNTFVAADDTWTTFEKGKGFWYHIYHEGDLEFERNVIYPGDYVMKWQFANTTIYMNIFWNVC